MPDYYTLQQLARKLGMEEGETLKLLTKGSFTPTVKNGRNYYRARQLHQAQAALRLAHKQGSSFEAALRVVLERVSRVKEDSIA